MSCNMIAVGTCTYVIYEADYMQAVTEIPVRKPVKLPTFGTQVGQFCREDGVQKSKDDYLAAEERNCLEGKRAAEAQFYSKMRASDYGREVVAEVRTLIEEMSNSIGSADLPCPMNAVSSTRLDFSAHAIWQVPTLLSVGEESSDNEVIEAMRTSASQGGYTLAWLEALYRGRGEGMEEGVGPFITALLDMHTSDPDVWVSFKQQEFRWVHSNFNRKGLAVSVNLFATDFLNPGIVETLRELHREDAAAFKLLHVELLEHEDANCPDIIRAILDIHDQTGLMLARDDVSPETLSDPVRRRQLIELFRSLRGALTVLKLDSSFVCGAMNVPLVPRSFSRPKAAFDAEVPSRRRYREAWAAGMPDAERKFPFPMQIHDTAHFTAKSVVRTYANQKEALEHGADVVVGFLEVSEALGYAVDIVAEVSVYANDFRRQLEHPVFGAFVKALLLYARKGKLFIQGSMCGGRAMSDSIVPSLVARPVQDSSGAMKELIRERQNSPHGGADENYHISEDFAVYGQYAEAVSRVQVAGATFSPRSGSGSIGCAG